MIPVDWVDICYIRRKHKRGEWLRFTSDRVYIHRTIGGRGIVGRLFQ